jgi:hypothetical protein
MQCRRCHGLTIVDTFVDMTSGGDLRWLQAWHCVNCGNMRMPGITPGRRSHRSLWSRLVDWLRNAWSRLTEPATLAS